MTRGLQVTAGLLLCWTLCLSTLCLVASACASDACLRGSAAPVGCVPQEDVEAGTPWPVVTMLLGGAAAFAAAGVVALGRPRSGDRGRARLG